MEAAIIAIIRRRLFGILLKHIQESGLYGMLNTITSYTDRLYYILEFK